MITIKVRVVESEYVPNTNDIGAYAMAKKLKDKYGKSLSYYYNIFKGKTVSESKKNELMSKIKSLNVKLKYL